MRKVGEILKKTRFEKKLNLGDVGKATKIRLKYLQFLENDDYQRLPGLTYTRGFIKNYGEFLGLSSKELLAVFRRTIDERKSFKLIPSGVAEPLNQPVFTITPTKTIVFAFLVALLLFLGYLAQEFYSFTRPPALKLSSPAQDAVIYSEIVEIQGKTDKDTLLTLNGQIVSVDSEGNFKEKIDVVPGTVNLIFVAKNKSGKETRLERTLRIESRNSTN